MNELKTMTAVYCYMFPETWNALQEVKSKVTRSLFGRTTLATDLTSQFSDVFNPRFEFPANKEGPLKDFVNLDELFVPVSEQVIERYSTVLLGIKDFENVYPCPASSDALVKTLTILQVQGTKQINILKGEYEGYGITSQALGMNVTEHDPATLDPKKITPGVWYLSNPSAIDGNILPDELIKELLENGNKLVLDFAYIGSTKPHVFDVSHENVAAVIWSPSKPYGVFESRLTGFSFLREKHFPNKQAGNFLYGNRWFTDKVRTLQTLKIVQEFGPREDGSTLLHEIYSPVQKKIVVDLNNEFDLGLKAADAFLIAYLNKSDTARLDAQQQQQWN